MHRNLLIGIVVAGLLALGVGAWGYNRLQGDTQAASGPITTIPLPTNVPAAGDTAAPTTAPADAAASTAVPADTVPAAALNGELRFQIVPAESKASFILQEDLREGQRISSFVIESATADGWMTVVEGQSVHYVDLHNCIFLRT